MIFEIRVVTNANKSEVKEYDDIVKVRVSAKPIDGEANKEIIKLLAEHFKVPEGKVKIIRGHKTNKKTVENIN
jgi:uncharacterized protein (TIGR00251 family)